MQVAGPEPLRAVTATVAAALGASVDAASIGALADTVPGIEGDDVAARIAAAFDAEGVAVE